MKLIVGLGNHEEKYKNTRHNIGFMVIDQLLRSLTPVGREFKEKKSFKALFIKLPLEKEEIVIIKPQTFMNGSGWAVAKAASFYKIEAADIWVVHDDIDLPLGKIRIRRGGASGGHHGIESIMAKIGSTDFVRFRLGVGRGMLDTHHPANKNLHRRQVEKIVLSPFAEGEVGDARKMIKHADQAIRSALKDGLEKAMNRHN